MRHTSGTQNHTKKSLVTPHYIILYYDKEEKYILFKVETHSTIRGIKVKYCYCLMTYRVRVEREKERNREDRVLPWKSQLV